MPQTFIAQATGFFGRTWNSRTTMMAGYFAQTSTAEIKTVVTKGKVHIPKRCVID